MSDATAHLRTLAQRLSDAYVAHTRPRAVLLLGSAATGDADAYSDLDLLLYYDELPSEDAFAEARHEIGAERFRGKRDETGYGERYFLGRLECQVGHASIAVWEQEIARVVVDLELDRVLLKEMSGLFEGLPLYGEDLIERWRRDATYTEPLQRAMIEKHWRFFPWWYFAERLGARDATIWRYDVLVQSAYNIVGVVAALNGLYFSTFEFKRASKFLSRLEVAPPNLAARLNTLFHSDARESTAELERLVAETQALIARRFPDLDLSLAWGGKPTPPGAREAPWTENPV